MLALLVRGRPPLSLPITSAFVASSGTFALAAVGRFQAAVVLLVVIGFAQPAQAVNFTMGGALRGSGDTRFTMSTTIVNWFVVRLPLAVLFAFPFGLGLAGIWLAVLVDYCVRAVILALRFRSGRWSKRVL